MLKTFKHIKMAKKTTKNAKPMQKCGPKAGHCCGIGLLLVLIIVLVWVSSATWSKVVITIAAGLMLLGKLAMHGCMYKKK